MPFFNLNQPAFYFVPAKAYQALMDKLEDMEFADLVRQRLHEDPMKVSIDDV